MTEVNYVVPLLVSVIFAVCLYIFYLYKKENPVVLDLFSSWYMKTRYSRAIVQKDTRKEDSILLVVLIILILALGLKLIVFSVVVSDSMRPEFQRGDMVLSQAIFKDPQKGDIITFRADGVTTTVTHRVVSVSNVFVTTKGDNNPLADDYGTTKNDVVAKAIVIDGHPIVLKGIGSLFILDFSKEGKLYKFGDQYEFLQNFFIMIRTWGYVITIIAFSGLIMSMFGTKK